MLMLRAARRDKAGYVFDLYDDDHSGEMERSEVLSLVIASQEAVENAAAAAASAIREIDIDGDGTLTLDEFVTAARTNPKVRGCRCSAITYLCCGCQLTQPAWCVTSRRVSHVPS